MLSVKNAAPAKIKAIMQYSRVPPSKLSLKVAQLSEPCTPEMTSEPSTPMAAASVAVATPE